MVGPICKASSIFGVPKQAWVPTCKDSGDTQDEQNTDQNEIQVDM